MKKIEYLKLALSNPIHRTKNWVLSLFALTRMNMSEHPGDVYYLKVVRNELGYFFYNESAVLEKIDDADTKEPIFNFLDKITIDNTWIESCLEPTETTIGNLLVNKWCVFPAFGNKFPFVTGVISIESIEAKISEKLQDTPVNESERSNQYYYVDEYLKFVDSLQFVSTLSQLSTYAGTRKNITAPTGIKEFKAKLLKEYEGRLSDPVILAEFEGKLKDFDSEYLKDDPSYGKFVTGKIKDTARKKMFLSLGAEQGFKDTVKVNPVINSLEEGWPSDPEQFTEMMNGLRAGSYSRGAETVNGGVAAKVLLRASNNFKIEDKDCGTNLGISRTFNKGNIDSLVGRYILQGSKTLFMENKIQTDNYLNQEIKVRSPMYCKLEGDRICKVCAGNRLSQFTNGIAIPLTEITSTLLNASMKKMHSTVLKTSKLNISEFLT